MDCCNLGDRCLIEPFFDQSIHQFLQRNPCESRTIPFEELAELNAKNPAREPSGFIFHLSRCGSTLIAQMLASLPQFVVLSEPAILETLLRNRYQPVPESQERQVWLLKNVIQALVNHRDDWKGAFIKFSPRAILDYRLITEAYPSVPRIFVYREPVEVLVSLSGSQVEQLPPGLENADLLCEGPDAIRMMRPAEFWARVVAGQCAAALEMSASSNPLLINYSQLPEAVWTKLTSFCGTSLFDGDVKRMQEVLRRSAKDPGKLFRDDRAAKRAAATAETQAAASRFVQPCYDRLESLRQRVDPAPAEERIDLGDATGEHPTRSTLLGFEA